MAFRLQSILRYRKNLEDMAQVELTTARQHCQRIADKKQAEKERMQDIRQALHEQQRQGADGYTLTLYEQCLQGAALAVRQLDQELEKAQQEVRSKKEALHAACQDKRLLEKLKERHEQRAMQEERRLETMRMDEVASTCWGGKG